MIGKNDSSVSVDLLSIIKLTKLMHSVKRNIKMIQVMAVEVLYPFAIRVIPKGMIANNGKILKKEKTDLLKT
jgi:hypothetical protein